MLPMLDPLKPSPFVSSAEVNILPKSSTQTARTVVLPVIHTFFYQDHCTSGVICSMHCMISALYKYIYIHIHIQKLVFNRFTNSLSYIEQISINLTDRTYLKLVRISLLYENARHFFLSAVLHCSVWPRWRCCKKWCQMYSGDREKSRFFSLLSSAKFSFLYLRMLPFVDVLRRSLLSQAFTDYCITSCICSSRS